MIVLLVLAAWPLLLAVHDTCFHKASHLEVPSQPRGFAAPTDVAKLSSLYPCDREMNAYTFRDSLGPDFERFGADVWFSWESRERVQAMVASL